jgi:hypothetical protein
LSVSARRREAAGAATNQFVIQERVFAQLFAMLRSLFFRASAHQTDLRGVSLSCAVLQQKIVEP